MIITNISPQVKNPNRVNISIDGKYSFSLTYSQVVDLKIKVGLELDESKLHSLKKESDYGKLYFRTLEYCLVRPRSIKEVSDYLYRKKVDEAEKTKLIDNLIKHRYLDDEKFARFWVENRMVKKGTSKKRLKMELLKKGVSSEVVDSTFDSSQRDEIEELKKVLRRKKNRYERDKLMAYLVRQGFSYQDVKDAIDQDEEESSSD